VNEEEAVVARSPHPILFALVTLPAGIAQGYLTITLPFMGRGAGISVSAISSIIAIGLMPLVLNFFWSPLFDLTLTYRRWCGIGALSCAAMLVLLSAAPLGPATINLVTLASFILMTGSTLIAVPLSAFIVHAVPEQFKGKAAGGFQVGVTGGTAMGGGAGVWLVAHFSRPITAGLVLGLLSLACLCAVYLMPETSRLTSGSLSRRIFGIGRELWDLVRRPRGALVVGLVITPIGVGAATNLWSAVAEEWHASADTVAAVTGVAGACAAAAGCGIGGWWADRIDRRVVYLAGGAILAMVGTTLAITPRTPVLFTTGTLSYTMTVGICNASFSALLFSTIGRGAAASKCAIVAGLGNLPVSYMTAFDGWLHDRSGTAIMLISEAFICLALIAVTAAILRSVPALGLKRIIR